MRYISVLLLAISLLLFSCQSDNSGLPTMPQPSQTDALSPGSQGELALVRPTNPGLPASIAIGELSDAAPAGENGYGASLSCSLAVRVRDSQGLFVEENTMIFIEIETVGVYSYPYCYVGEYGIAPVKIYYSSSNTYSYFDITVWCYSGTGTIEAAAEDLALPLYGGELMLNILPESWTWTLNTPAVLKVLPTLHDDFCNPIGNAPIHFENSLGMFFCTDSAEAAGPLENGWLYNGNWVSETLTNPSGQAALFMRIEAYTNYSVIPPYPGVFEDSTQVEVIIEVMCDVVGEDVSSDPVDVTFRRVLP